MSDQNLDKDKMIQYWTYSSDEDYDTMLAMHNSKRYSWALFVGHLMIEKLLKAVYVKVNEASPPFTHNLLRLAEESNIKLDEENRLFFTTVTAFNINARYDDYKMSFQKKCTPAFTLHWIELLKVKRLWMKELIDQ